MLIKIPYFDWHLFNFLKSFNKRCFEEAETYLGYFMQAGAKISQYCCIFGKFKCEMAYQKNAMVEENRIDQQSDNIVKF